MKKILCSLLLMVFTIIPVNVFAAGYISVSPTTITVTEGSTKTITITAYNAIGDVRVKSNNTGVATVSPGSWATGSIDSGITKKGTITVRGISEGSTTLTFNIDGATFDTESLKGQVKTVTVNVVKKPAPVVDNRSKNNKLKSITAVGHQLVKVNDNNYTLEVGNSVTKIQLDAVAEDSKAKVTGAGEHELKVGENNITVVVTAENGAKNNINVKIIRRDGYYLGDLMEILNNNSMKEASIIIKANDKITKEHVKGIRENKKLIRFNYQDENKRTLYSWILDGTMIVDDRDILTTMTYVSENEEEISKLSNYSEGIYLNFKHSGNLPTGTKIKIYVGEKYKNENLVNLYHYDGTKLNKTKGDIKVVNGYIEFEITHCSEYFITRAVLENPEISSSLPSGMDKFFIISLVELGIIIILAGLMIVKNNKASSRMLVKGKIPLDALFMTPDEVFPTKKAVKN